MEKKFYLCSTAALVLGCMTSPLMADGTYSGGPSGSCPSPCPAPVPAPCPAPAPEPTCPAPEPVCPPKCDTPPAGKIDECDMNSPACVITPDAGPRVCMGADVFVTADFILWTPRQEGLEFAMTGAQGNITNQGDLIEPDFGLEPGFKVGLGLNLGHDGWDMFLEYTWLRSCVSESKRSNTMVNLWDTVLTPTRMRGSWDYDLNNFDLEIGRNFFVSQYLSIRPHYGFKGGWQSQDYVVRAELGNINRKMVQDFDYWGFGIRTGFDTAWHLNSSWSIFGNFALSALWSSFDIDRKDTDFDGAVTTTNVNTNNDFHTILPVLEIAIGVRWEMWFSDDDYHFGIDAGWEEQVWWGMNRLIVINQPQRDNGDLTFQGLTLKFRFDF